MMFDGMGLFDAIKGKLRWADARQSVLARNIANASTPGFTPSDIKAPDFEKILKGTAGTSGMMRTHAAHMNGQRGGATGRGLEYVAQSDAERTPDGNGVQLEEQMARVAETQIAYAEALGLYRKTVGLWRAALGARAG